MNDKQKPEITALNKFEHKPSLCRHHDAWLKKSTQWKAFLQKTPTELEIRQGCRPHPSHSFPEKFLKNSAQNSLPSLDKMFVLGRTVSIYQSCFLYKLSLCLLSVSLSILWREGEMEIMSHFCIESKCAIFYSIICNLSFGFETTRAEKINHDRAWGVFYSVKWLAFELLSHIQNLKKISFH